MRRKWILLLCVVAAVTLLLSGCAYSLPFFHTYKIQHIVCTEDYPALYAQQLREMLGEYTVGERVEKRIEGESCSCGYHQDAVDYYAWEITYQDICGQTMTCELDNHTDFYAQQLEWMEDQIEAHFFEQYVMRHGENVSSEGSYCYCRVGDIISSWSSDEELRRMETAEKYRADWIKAEEIIPLYALEYDSVFNDYPVVMSVNIRTDNEADPDAMVENILLDTNESANMCVRLPGRAECYVAGEKLPEGSAAEFDGKVYESYIGVFWD